MRSTAVVPVRCGSKSIKMKNIKDFCGQPLSYWALKALSDSQVDEVIVGTDCEEIGNVVAGFELDKVKVYYRKAENATDTASTESFMQEVAKEYKLPLGQVLILVQVTSPFITSKDIDGALTLLHENNLDSLLSCVPFTRFIWDASGTPTNYDYLKRPRRQEISGQFLENGAFYMVKTDSFYNNGNRLGGQIGIYEMPEYTAVEIDEEYDWVIAEKLFTHYKHDQ